MVGPRKSENPLIASFPLGSGEPSYVERVTQVQYCDCFGIDFPGPASF